MTTFSILEKIFLKIENLMCALRVHVNRNLPKIQAVLTLNGSLQHMWSKWKSVGHNFQVLYLGISSQKIKTTPIFAHSFLRNFIGSMFIADHHWSFFLFDSDVLGMMEFSTS